MKFGTYFAYWADRWQVDYLDYIPLAKKAGFDVLEISSGIADLDDRALACLRDAARDAGIELTLCLGLPQELDVSSSSAATREKGVAFMKHLLVAMDKADVRKVGGIIYAYWPCDFSKPVDKPTARMHSIVSVREIADFAAPLGIELELETVNRFEQFLINDAREAVAFVKDVGRENVRVMLDSFHMNIEEDFIGDAIRETGGLLGHFHIGECNRKVPGRGHMPWEEIARALKDIHYQGAVVMEPFVKPGGQVGADIKVWRDLSEGADCVRLDNDIKESLNFLRGIFK